MKSLAIFVALLLLTGHPGLAFALTFLFALI